jgi:hypothetical protein
MANIFIVLIICMTIVIAVQIFRSEKSNTCQHEFNSNDTKIETVKKNLCGEDVHEYKVITETCYNCGKTIVTTEQIY